MASLDCCSTIVERFIWLVSVSIKQVTVPAKITYRVAVVLFVEKVGDGDDQLVVAIAIDVANRGVAQDVGVHEDEALLPQVRHLQEALILPQVVLRQWLHRCQNEMSDTLLHVPNLSAKALLLQVRRLEQVLVLPQVIL